MIALGLGADSGIFLQPLWQADELQYLVINDRDEAVDILDGRLSANGRFLLVTRGAGVFVRDRFAARTISIAAPSAPTTPAISADGRYVAYAFGASPRVFVSPNPR